VKIGDLVKWKADDLFTEWVGVIIRETPVGDDRKVVYWTTSLPTFGPVTSSHSAGDLEVLSENR
jgi:hypothetical protein